MTISGVGCWVVDYIYQDIDFLNPTVQKYLSKDGEKGMIINGYNSSYIIRNDCILI